MLCLHLSGTGVINVSNLSHVDFAPNGFEGDRYMRGGVALEGNGFGRLYWESGTVGTELAANRVRCHTVRQVAAIVWGLFGR